MTTGKTSGNINEQMKKLRAITEWFDAQDEIDIEKGIEKIKEGAALITETKKRLAELENEFEDVKKKLAAE